MSYTDKKFEKLTLPMTWTAGAVVVVGLILSVLLMLGDRRENHSLNSYGVRAAVDMGVAPASGAIAQPVRWAGEGANWLDDYFFAVSENRRLRKRVEELSQYRDLYIQMKDINARYEKLLQLRTEPPVEMVTARSVSVSRGPFANNRLIDAGEKQGVRFGNPVITEHGLVGRVVGTSGSVSRVVMLTDVASRVPVLVNRTDSRAILVGDGGKHPRLEFTRGQNAVTKGDQILTSGDGGMFPRGLPVGVVAQGLDGVYRVKLYADRSPVDLVRVLKFKDFSQLTNPQALASPPLSDILPPVPAGDAPNLSLTTASTAPRPAPRPVQSPSTTSPSRPPGSQTTTSASQASPSRAAPTQDLGTPSPVVEQ